MPDNTESTAKINFKQAIIVALITSITTIIVTLISSGVNPLTSGTDNKTTDCSVYKSEIENLKAELNQSISFENLSDISPLFFKDVINEQSVKDSLRIINALAGKHLEEKNHSAYNLFLLKKVLMSKPRGNINTRIENDDKSTYILIQKTLKNIQFYTGSITGDRMETYQALVEFQKKQNQRTNDYFQEDNFGILGNKTYLAIMQYYEHTN